MTGWDPFILPPAPPWLKRDGDRANLTAAPAIPASILPEILEPIGSERSVSHR